MMNRVTSENRMMKADTTENQVMPRNGREGTHLPFAHLFLDYPSKRNIPVNWAKDEPDLRRAYPSTTKKEEST